MEILLNEDNESDAKRMNRAVLNASKMYPNKVTINRCKIFETIYLIR